jgi:hypothetical protein
MWCLCWWAGGAGLFVGGDHFNIWVNLMLTPNLEEELPQI